LGGTFLTAVTFCIFPNGRFVPRWSRWLALVLVGLAVAVPVWPGSASILENPDHDWLAPILFGIPFCFIVVAQIYRYWRVSDAVERQQT
jgi:hypothetical protein